MKDLVVGIDFGAKMAGTTVLAVFDNAEVAFICSKKGSSADLLVRSTLSKGGPGTIAIDAPLSLPAVYRDNYVARSGAEGSDYHFRACDKALGAMSPMFLGGLSARAMELSAWLRGKNFEVVETYPRASALRIGLDHTGYKNDGASVVRCADAISEECGFTLQRTPVTWHEIDALLALSSAIRHREGKCQSYGSLEEGLIVL